MRFSRISRGAVALRAARVFAVLAGRSLLLGPAAAAARLRGERFKRDVWLADTVVALGPAFVKAAQLLSTRADLLPPRVCRALSRLHDQVRPVPPRTMPPALRFGAGEPRLVGAGSIACVYRVVLPDGRAVAAKVRRPGIVRSSRLTSRCWNGRPGRWPGCRRCVGCRSPRSPRSSPRASARNSTSEGSGPAGRLPHSARRRGRGDRARCPSRTVH